VPQGVRNGKQHQPYHCKDNNYANKLTPFENNIKTDHIYGRKEILKLLND
jgi:hypothetical protein